MFYFLTSPELFVTVIVMKIRWSTAACRRGHYMQVRFKSPTIGALCNSGGKLVQTLGEEAADKVKDLLFYLDAAPTLADLSKSPPVLRDRRPSHRSPQFTVGRAGNGQVLFQPKELTSSIELNRVDSISVISVGETV